jgi:hypothetical protein
MGNLNEVDVQDFQQIGEIKWLLGLEKRQAPARSTIQLQQRLCWQTTKAHERGSRREMWTQDPELPRPNCTIGQHQEVPCYIPSEKDQEN